MNGNLVDFSKLELQKDHENRPIWACPDGHVYLETSSPIFTQAYDFLIAIAEPICRPEFLHEYQITPYSLYAAASVGLEYSDIVSGLERLSKTVITDKLRTFVRENTEKCGKVRLVLRNGRFFLEALSHKYLTTLIKGSPEILAAKIDISETLRTLPHLKYHESGFLMSEHGSTATIKIGKREVDQQTAMGIQRDPTGGEMKDEDEDDAVEMKQVYLFEVNPDKVEEVRKHSQKLGYPTLEEYDFRQDTLNEPLAINLKATTDIRPYQEKSLSKMFGNGRARSGIIVLPCGAGKTLTGIVAASTIRKSVIVFATTGVSCEQWKGQFLKWANIGGTRNEKTICMFTAAQKDPIPEDRACIVITTYSMVAFTQRRSREAQQMMEAIKGREWGLVLMDEVHVAPADMFRRCLTITKSLCKLGLTATLVREDEKIEDLFFMIGPKLYEADWMDLQRNGYIATVQCIEVWCPMSPLFYRQFLKEKSVNKKTLLQAMNPNKFRNCEYLIRYHEARGDKIMVFSDNIYSLQYYAKKLELPYIYGATSDQERMATLASLQTNDQLNTILISKVGDCSIDLPDVNVIIQISSYFSSRRQEAQRLGRILRPKAKSNARAYFYTLVSQDTLEGLYAAKRQRFLVDQGYSFHVKASQVEPDDTQYSFATEDERKQLLMEVIAAQESAGSIESIDMDPDAPQATTKKAIRKTGSLSALAGGADATYEEAVTSSSSSNGNSRKRKKKSKGSSKLGNMRNNLMNAKRRKMRHDEEQLQALMEE